MIAEASRWGRGVAASWRVKYEAKQTAADLKVVENDGLSDPKSEKRSSSHECPEMETWHRGDAPGFKNFIFIEDVLTRG